MTGAGWTTGAARVTGITTALSTGNGLVTAYNNTVTLDGAYRRTSGGAGTVLLVAPARIRSNTLGNLPAFAVQTLHFSGPTVPEPGTLLLLCGCAAGLAAAGRKRVSK